MVAQLVTSMLHWSFPDIIDKVFALDASRRRQLKSDDAVPEFRADRLAELETEMARCGVLIVDDPFWNRSKQNHDYAVCETYPGAVVVPKAVPEVVSLALKPALQSMVASLDVQVRGVD